LKVLDVFSAQLVDPVHQNSHYFYVDMSIYTRHFEPLYVTMLLLYIDINLCYISMPQSRLGPVGVSKSKALVEHQNLVISHSTSKSDVENVYTCVNVITASNV
jgi:hypothetical protein